MFHRLGAASFFAFVAASALPTFATAQPAPSASSTPMMAPVPMATGTASPIPLATPTPVGSASPAVSPSPSPSPSPHLFVLTGFGDVGYSAINDTNKVRFVNNTPSRIYDGVSGPFSDANGGKLLNNGSNFNNSFDLQSANVQLAINGGPVTGKIEGLIGTDADTAASNGQSRSGTNLYQSYLTFTGGPVALTVGKFGTLAGVEVLEAPSNTNYSRNYLYGLAVPFTNTGARAQFTINPKIAVVAGVNNGWDDWKFVNKGAKTLEGGLLLTPSPLFALTLDTYNGGDFAVGGNSTIGLQPAFSNRMLYDGVLTIHATSALTILGEYDNGTQLADKTGTLPTQHWNGVSGYLNYQFTPLYLLSLRTESFHDTNGFRTGIAQRLQSNTATVSYSPGNYIFRAEYRIDASDGNNFQYRNDGIDPITGLPGGRPHQSSLGFEAVLKVQ